MKSVVYSLLALFLYGVLTGRGVTVPVHAQEGIRLPEFTETHRDAWINSEPLSNDSLQGKVVIVDFWTFACWNCYRSFPWLNSLYQNYHGKGLEIVGVHAPEFDYEKRKPLLEKKVQEFKLQFPIMIDNNKGYWQALGNRYWPAYYVVDKKGVIRGTFVGETHAGDKNARAMERLLQELLAES